jgi:uncharacterized membrane protein (UPF0127 family)
MKKATRKKLVEWTITGLLLVLLVVVAEYRFNILYHLGLTDEPWRRPGQAAVAETEWHELPAVATVEVARTLDEITRGLMGRDSLPPDGGMYFLYPGTAERALDFYMKNTRIPLSIAFIRADGTIATIKDMQPFDETLVSSEGPVKDALEMNQGWFADHNIEAGDRALLQGNEVHFHRRSR